MVENAGFGASSAAPIAKKLCEYWFLQRPTKPLPLPGGKVFDAFPAAAAGRGGAAPMRERFRALDPYLLMPILVLMFMGTLTIFSASRGTTQSSIWLKQSLWNLFGFALMLFVSRVRPGRVFNWSAGFYIVGILLLAAVLVPHVGQEPGRSPAVDSRRRA